MSFQGKYRILSALSEGEVRLFRALQISSGRQVLVHHLTEGHAAAVQPDLASLIFRFLRSASVKQSRDLLDMGEDEGRIFVVTADVPECLDLRKWLKSVPEPPAEKDGEPQPSEETPSPTTLDSTTAFTAEALRVLFSPKSTPAPSSPELLAAPPAVSNPEESPGVSEPPAEQPAELSDEVPDAGPAAFVEFWESASVADHPGHPTPVFMPPIEEKSVEGSSEALVIPEVSAEFLSRPSSLSIPEAPGPGMTDLPVSAAEPEGESAAEAGSAESMDSSGQSVDLVLTPPEVVMTLPVAPGEAEISIPLPPPAVTPEAGGHETEIIRGSTDLLGENDQGSQQAAASESTPGAEDKQEAEIKSAEEIPGPQISTELEVVFQSSQPPLDAAWLDLPDQSGSLAAPAPIEPPIAPEEPTPTPSAAVLPDVAPPDTSLPTERIVDSPAWGSPDAPGDQMQSLEAAGQSTAPPAPPQAQAARKEPEPAAWSIPAPAVPPTRPAPPAPVGDAATAGGKPPLSPPLPTPPDRTNAGEHIRMLENMRAVAAPRPPVAPPGVPHAGDRPTARPATPAPAPARASSPRVPAPQTLPHLEAPPQPPPALYLAHDTPWQSARKKRQSWVPVLILSSLLVMTVALLLFFAFKH